MLSHDFVAFRLSHDFVAFLDREVRDNKQSFITNHNIALLFCSGCRRRRTQLTASLYSFSLLFGRQSPIAPPACVSGLGRPYSRGRSCVLATVHPEDSSPLYVRVPVLQIWKDFSGFVL